MRLPSSPENVALAREALAGLAQTVPLSREQHDDVRTAVTEACNNVVQHAYGEHSGPMELQMRIVRDALEVVVRDEGVGLTEMARDGAGELEIGLPVILALSDRVELGHGPDGGTEVQMRFAIPGVEGHVHPLPSESAEERELPALELPAVHAGARVAFSSARLAGAILPRVACALAARARFTADRVSDVQLLSDSLAARASAESVDRRLEVALAIAPHRLAIQVGLLRRGAAERLLADGAPSASALARLVDDHAVTGMGMDEVLVLYLDDTP